MTSGRKSRVPFGIEGFCAMFLFITICKNNLFFECIFNNVIILRKYRLWIHFVILDSANISPRKCE